MEVEQSRQACELVQTGNKENGGPNTDDRGQKFESF